MISRKYSPAYFFDRHTQIFMMPIIYLLCSVILTKEESHVYVFFPLP